MVFIAIVLIGDYTHDQWAPYILNAEVSGIRGGLFHASIGSAASGSGSFGMYHSETRLRTGLIGMGLSERQSTCMADRMARNLSITQLRRIAALGSLRNQPLDKLSQEEFLHKIRALRDHEILAVSLKAAAGCAFGF